MSHQIYLSRWAKVLKKGNPNPSRYLHFDRKCFGISSVWCHCYCFSNTLDKLDVYIPVELLNYSVYPGTGWPDPGSEQNERKVWWNGDVREKIQSIPSFCIRLGTTSRPSSHGRRETWIHFLFVQVSICSLFTGILNGSHAWYELRLLRFTLKFTLGGRLVSFHIFRVFYKSLHDNCKSIYRESE